MKKAYPKSLGMLFMSTRLDIHKNTAFLQAHDLIGMKNTRSMHLTKEYKFHRQTLVKGHMIINF